MFNDDGIGAAMSLDAAGRDVRKALEEVKKLQSRIKHLEEENSSLRDRILDIESFDRRA